MKAWHYCADFIAAYAVAGGIHIPAKAIFSSYTSGFDALICGAFFITSVLFADHYFRERNGL